MLQFQVDIQRRHGVACFQYFAFSWFDRDGRGLAGSSDSSYWWSIPPIQPGVFHPIVLGVYQASTIEAHAFRCHFILGCCLH